ncbi:MAG: DEAD/DEAH box helicase [Kiritimatiellae bacterium]|nr:DEAD/DEAH box helicase [Kiritimatiellia bacterium]
MRKIWGKLSGKPHVVQEPVAHKHHKRNVEQAKHADRKIHHEHEDRSSHVRKPHRQDEIRHMREPAGPPWTPEMFVVPLVEGKTRFHDLRLPDQIMHAIADLDFKYCTPIQEAILPHLLEGKDAAGRAQTGTGKTAAFLIEIFTHFICHPITQRRRNGTPRALILSPTRELALQIGRDAVDLAKYCPFKILTVYGGTEYEKQRSILREQTVDVVVATPGRLLDFQRSRVLDLRHVEILVIDEADRMLDMGFIPDVSSIIRSTPPKEDRQTMLFSATLTDSVMKLASKWQKSPVKVDIEPEQVAVDTVNQIVYLVTSEEKFAITINILVKEHPERALVFGNRRDETEHLMKELRRFGVKCALLSGAVPQNVRTRTLDDFRSGKIPVLVATGVASRGLHIEGVTHVINFNIPEDPEDYVHRIGRTGRAGETGTSITFACEDESFRLPSIEEYIGQTLKCTYPDESLLILPEPKEGPRSTTALRRHGSMGDQSRYGGHALRGRRPRSGGHSRPRR